MKYNTIDGIIIEGNNSRELIQNLRSQSIFQYNTMSAFMKQVSDNVKIDTSNIIRAEIYDDFINDLINAGYITLQE